MEQYCSQLYIGGLFFLQLRSCDIYRKNASDLRDIVESVDNDKTEGDQEDNPNPCQV